jgi:L-seryl-tRNA(Ser) seleniumtransferase
MSNFRDIPSIEQLRQRAGVRAMEAQFGAAATVDALRAAAANVRHAMSTQEGAEADTRDRIADRLETAAAAHLASLFRPSLQPVINATGVIVHTNLGRAPLSHTAAQRVVDIATGYSTLEYDLARGARGRRDTHAEASLCRLTGAEAAVVVNNNAAATMIVLAALAVGREVIVSRGELVEIGGGFRVPDVMAQSGAILREVGTTNRTRVSDYAAAASERTALILRVHPSNFRIEGFTERPALADLVAAGRKLNIPVAEDLGSGNLGSGGSGRSGGSGGSGGSDLPEPAVRASIEAGVDVCCFSGDKLLGGPQAGIIVGRAALIDRIRTHPLMRALRVDKMTYAALEATLTEYVTGRAAEAVPVQRMLSATAEEIRVRAEAIARQIGAREGWRIEIIAGASATGGGSAPGVELATHLLAIDKSGASADALELQLRQSTPPVIARIERDRLVIDLRTVLPEQDATLATILTKL